MKKNVYTSITEKVKKNGTIFLAVMVLLPVLLALAGCGTTSSSTRSERVPVIKSNDKRDYICLVNVYLHPNMELYINNEIRGYISKNDSKSDDNAANLEITKRGATGSGFVYVDKKGNNYIITNYHVIVGAYRLSVTFESEEGDVTVYKNLSVFSVDEQGDLAILAFPNGQKPFRRGFPFFKSPLRSGTAVHAAGYPGNIHHEPVWNFDSGTVGNFREIIPGREDPFIRHSASVNPGNSGGPLLVEDNSSPMKYSVAGVNTLKVNTLEGGNYAIPVERVEAFIQRSFEQANEKDSLENRAGAFMELLVKSTTSARVYDDLSSFLSSTMINADPATTVRIVRNSTNYPRDISNKVNENPAIGIAWAVAYNKIESLIWRKAQMPLAQKIKPEVMFPSDSNNMGGYTVRLLVNGYPYRTEWVRDYGTWKLDVFEEDDGEYNDYSRFATPHPLGKRVIYSLSSGLDVDWYTLDIPKSGKLTVWTEGNIDPVITLCYDPSTEDSAKRTYIGGNDDYPGLGQNALFSSDVHAGTVYVTVSMASGGPGEYILAAGLEGTHDEFISSATQTGAPARTSTPASSGPPITIVNDTGYTIYLVNIRQAGSGDWGPDRLASNQVIRNGESVSVQLPYPINTVNRYDIRVADIMDTYTKINQTVTAAGRIVFTERDID